MNLMLRDLMFCLLLKFTATNVPRDVVTQPRGSEGQSDVIGSHEPVHVTVGHDVILPCHLEPPYDVRTLTVEWKCNESIVHVYRDTKDYLEDQDKNFRGRTSLFLDELANGNISLKLTNVTEQDEGNYSCFVPKLDSQVRRDFIDLRVDPEENRDKGGQTDSDKKTEENNNNRHRGFIVPVIVVASIIVIVAIGVTWKRRANNNAGRDRRGQHEMVEMSEMANSRDEGRVQDETGEDDT